MISDSLPFDLSGYDKLTPIHIGHIRHFYNLAHQADGDWRHMGSQEPAQEFLDAYRYQLATMAYALSATHYHRTPALRSVFKPLIRRLIHKMLLRACWGYWYNTSRSGKFVDPDLEKLREPWSNPVVRENIMYSGHLLLMTSLYAMLFDDDEFERPNSIVFDWNPLFWGEPEKFFYDNRSLQQTILQQMEENKWVGVCCEPNTVFVACNQFPMIAMRYNDVRDDTNVVDGVLEKYKAAWEKKGLVMKDGLFPDWWMVKQDQVLPGRDIGFTAWAAAFMNPWNHDLVKSLYTRQALGFITNVGGEVRMQPRLVASRYREAAEISASATANGTPNDAKLLSKVVEDAKAYLADPDRPADPFPYAIPTFGYVLKWLSELGKCEELEGILQYADERLNPTWENGGLYYPRNDTPYNEDMEWTHMDPFSGNAGIGYSRLNVPNGQKIMWEIPWTKETLKAQPWVDGIDFSMVAVSRGVWDHDIGALIVTVQGWDFEKSEEEVTISPTAKNLPAGNYAVYVKGQLQRKVKISLGESIESAAEVVKRGEEVSFVFVQT